MSTRELKCRCIIQNVSRSGRESFAYNKRHILLGLRRDNRFSAFFQIKNVKIIGHARVNFSVVLHKLSIFELIVILVQNTERKNNGI